MNPGAHEVTISPPGHRFQGRVVVSEAEWLSSACTYDAASTVPGVTTALKTLKSRIGRGETISLFKPGALDYRRHGSCEFARDPRLAHPRL